MSSIPGVLGEIGKWWNLDDTQKGLIQTSFIICYFASAPVFGFLGDRHSRKWLMFFGVLAWGACTLASSFTKGGKNSKSTRIIQLYDIC